MQAASSKKGRGGKGGRGKGKGKTPLAAAAPSQSAAASKASAQATSRAGQASSFVNVRSSTQATLVLFPGSRQPVSVEKDDDVASVAASLPGQKNAADRLKHLLDGTSVFLETCTGQPASHRLVFVFVDSRASSILRLPCMPFVMMIYSMLADLLRRRRSSGSAA